MTHVVMTGPIVGEVQTADGTKYDVSPALVEVAPEHAAEVADLIGRHYETNGHPAVEGDFIHNTEKDN